MNEKELRKISEKYAESQGFKFNPNERIVETIIKGLLANEKKHGFRYCPCRAITGNKEKDSKIICPCAFHKMEIKNMGRCLCGLFVSKEYYNKNKGE